MKFPKTIESEQRHMAYSKDYPAAWFAQFWWAENETKVRELRNLELLKENCNTNPFISSAVSISLYN